MGSKTKAGSVGSFLFELAVLLIIWKPHLSRQNTGFSELCFSTEFFTGPHLLYITAVSCSPDVCMLVGVGFGIWWQASWAVHGVGAWVVYGMMAVRGFGVGINDVVYYYLDVGVVGLVRLDLEVGVWFWMRYGDVIRYTTSFMPTPNPCTAIMPCTTHAPTPCTDAMHCPACPVTIYQIRPPLTCRHQDYMILLLYFNQCLGAAHYKQWRYISSTK